MNEFFGRRVWGGRLPIWGLMIIVGLAALMILLPIQNPPNLQFRIPAPTAGVALTAEDIEAFKEVAPEISLSLVGVERMTDERFALVGLLIAIPLMVFLELRLARLENSRASMFLGLILVVYLFPIIQNSWGILEIGFQGGPKVRGAAAFFLIWGIGVWLVTKLGIVDFNPAGGIFLTIGLAAAAFLSLGYLGSLVKFGGDEVPMLVYPFSTTYELLKVWLPLALVSVFVLLIIYAGWALALYELLNLEDMTSIGVTIVVFLLYLYLRNIAGAAFPLAVGGATLAMVATATLLVAADWATGAYWTRYRPLGIMVVFPWNTINFALATAAAALVTFGRV